MEKKHLILAAFVNAIWVDEKAFAFLMKAKAFEWAACANIINGDDKAEAFLKRINKEHYVLLAHAKDLDHDGDAGGRAAGCGQLDYGAVLAELAAAGFDGTIVLHQLAELAPDRIGEAVDHVRRHAPECVGHRRWSHHRAPDRHHAAIKRGGT